MLEALIAADHVRTPEGAKKYGEPIGAVITKDVIARAARAAESLRQGGPGQVARGAIAQQQQPGTRDSILHRIRGFFRGSSTDPVAVHAVESFSPRMFQSDAQAGQYALNRAAKGRFSRGAYWSSQGRQTIVEDSLPGFHEAQTALRAGKVDDPKAKEFIARYKRNSAPTTDDLIVSRRVGLDAFPGGVEGLAGHEIRDDGYFQGNLGTPIGSTPVLLTVAVPKGTRAMFPGNGQSDRGVILDRGQRLHVTKVTPDGKGGFYVAAVIAPEGGAGKPQTIREVPHAPEAPRSAAVPEILQPRPARPGDISSTTPTPAGHPARPVPRSEPVVSQAVGTAGSKSSPVPQAPAPRKPEAPTTSMERLSPESNVREVQIDNRIRAAYRELVRYPGDWVSLASLRTRLGDDLTREEVDARLKAFAVQPGSHVIPWDNRKVLSRADREAAVRIGGDESHVIRLEDPSPRPVPEALKRSSAPETPKSGRALPDETVAKLNDPKTTVAQMRQIAKDHDVKVPSKITRKADIRDHLLGKEASAPEAGKAKVSETGKLDTLEARDAFKARWTEAGISAPAGSPRRELNEVYLGVRSGKLSPEEGARQLDSGIEIDRHELADIEKSLKRTDLSPANRKEEERRATMMRDSIDAKTRAAKLLRGEKVAKKATPAKGREEAAQLSDIIEGAPSEAAMMDAMDGVDGLTLRRVASELGVTIPVGMDTEALRSHIARSVTAFGSGTPDAGFEAKLARFKASRVPVLRTAKKAAPKAAKAPRDPITVKGSPERERLAKQIIREYHGSDNPSLKALGERHGKSSTFIHSLLTEHGVQLRPRGGAKRQDKVNEPGLAGTKRLNVYSRDGMRPGITDEEHVALSHYIGAARETNTGLREGKAADPTVVPLIDRVMAGSRTEHEVTVFRGLRTGRGLFGPRDSWPDDFTGKEWTDSGFVSTAATESQAADFARKAVTQEPGILLRIRVPKGTKAVDLRSGGLDEGEILLGRGLRFRVVGEGTPRRINGRGDVARVLDVEVISPESSRPISLLTEHGVQLRPRGGSERKPAAKATTPKFDPYHTPTAIEDHLRTLRSVDDGYAYMSGLDLSVTDSRRLARGLGLRGTDRMSVDAVNNLIVRTFVGSRLDSEALQTTVRELRPIMAPPGTGTSSPAARVHIRPELAAAHDPPSLAKATQSEFKRITGRDLTVDLEPPGVHVSMPTAREHMEGILRSAEAWPEVELDEVRWFGGSPSTPGKQQPWAFQNNRAILFNSYYLSVEGRHRYLREMDAGVADWRLGEPSTKPGFHPRNSNHASANASHEFAHIIDNNEEIHADVADLLRRRSAEAGISITRMLRRDISGYAAEGSRGKKDNIAEVIAEAFVDVAVNGDKASRLSKEIVELLRGAYRARHTGKHRKP